MSSKYLLMWLEAPLQSWGYDSKFGRRDTQNFPTKSGIFGLLCCALGAGGEQCDLLAELAPLNLQIFSFSSAHGNREPLLRDFHMVGAGYDLNDSWQKLLEPYKSDGKPRTSNGKGSKITYRYYLQDAYFAVILQAPKNIADKLANALQYPVWDLYLGRKNCAPTDFIYRGIFTSEKEAKQHMDKIAHEKNLKMIFSVLDGEYQEKGKVFTLNDVPIQFGVNKKYRDRYVTVVCHNEQANN